MTDVIENRINNGYCVVLGAGVSNQPLVKLLYERGARIVVRDRKEKTEIKNIETLEKYSEELICGEMYLCGLDTHTPPEETVIFRSPGLRHDLPEILSAVEKGAVLTSEMELFFRLTRANVIAITGSDGKTTTTTLIGKLLESGIESGNIYIGGNIGRPLLPENHNMTERDFAVVELSSFQLQTMQAAPHTAVITNVTPNHLNWHKDMEEYTEAKYNIFAGEGCRHLVVSADNELSLKAALKVIKKESAPRVTLFSLRGKSYNDVVPEELRGHNTSALYEKNGVIILSREGKETDIIKSSDIKIPGRHNVLNYMAAFAATEEFVASDTIKKLAPEFGGVEHRIELVREKDGVKYYNSSIDSTPTRTKAALSSFEQKLIVICGGRNKNLPFDTLAQTLCERAKSVVLTGESADEIMQALNEYDKFESSGLKTFICRGFEEAVRKAHSIASEGDTVILSPACTSFDAFDNFEERGNAFKNIVNSF
ncbi:MAG: UDP-N-acetylmuramoyl-L-alanine--D-glutamate ligase [Oscillospiraceae bacterium]|nr:UDP-N-acetylmuramoyl-L-alanine--D-glutamate ligase [Oscillospiraceae bacterium]